MSSSTKVVVAGANGQLGFELARANWPENFEVTLLDRQGLDISNEDNIKSVFTELAPDVFVNSAAYTAVDKAEEQRDLATAVNATAVAYLAKACAEHDAKLVHVSTDYVFDGAPHDGFYVETDEPSPVNFYGESKLAGERLALSYHNAVVLRASWVFSSHGKNFVKTMISMAAGGKDLGVVHDQLGCPTSASELAKVIVGVVSASEFKPGLYHAGSVTDGSWWDLAQTAIELSGQDVKVRQITTAQYPLPAKRPADTRTSSKKLADHYGLEVKDWRLALADVVSEISAQ